MEVAGVAGVAEVAEVADPDPAVRAGADPKTW
jgi:hypothetical protein